MVEMTSAGQVFQGTLAAVMPNRVFHLIYFVTARCNARCKMCFYLEQIKLANKNLVNELTTNEVNKLASTIGHVPYLSLSGGEPFLRRDIYQIIDSLVSSATPLLVSIPTNCAYPERVEDTARRLSIAHPNTQFDIQLSLDGPEKLHDEIRQVPGLYRRLIETHQRLIELQKTAKNLGTKIVITYSTFNQTEVGDLLDHISNELPVDRVILAKAHGNCAPETKDGMDMELFRRLLIRAEQINSQNAHRRKLIGKLTLGIKSGKEKLRERFERESNLGKYCGAGEKLVVLGETGTVYPCEILDRPLGNIRDHNYNLHQTLNSAMPDMKKQGVITQCHCDWGCAQNIAVVTSPRFWRHIL